MVIKTTDFKQVCSTILAAIDNSEISSLTESLELTTQGKVLYLNVTNNEYYASVIFPLDHEEPFHAVVNANMFLKLIVATTTDEITLEVKPNYLNVVANGNYKIPFMCDENGQIVSLNPIVINNKTLDMKISGEILESIVTYNSKEINSKHSNSSPVQKMYYLDENGCVTYVIGACINNFQLEKPIKVLFSQRLVKLFKLFKKDMIDFELGYDMVGDIIQTKVSFNSPIIKVTAITGCNDELLSAFPINNIRGLLAKTYNYNLELNKDDLSQALSRLLLFYSKQDTTYGSLNINGNILSISGKNDNCQETILLNETFNTPITVAFDLNDLKSALDNVNEDYISISVDADKPIKITRKSIINFIPKLKIA